MKDVAKHLASKGRNGDTMLVHMSPEEVAGLQYLALASGGPLTINPDTGLVEAFKLGKLFKSLLPTIAGGLLAATGVGAPLAALMVGGGTGLATGDWKKGLLAGVGAFGGAGIGQALAGAGQAAGQAAATNYATMGAANQASATAMGKAGETALKEGFKQVGGFGNNLSLMGQGLKSIVPGTASYVPGMATQVGSAIGSKGAFAAAVPTLAAMQPAPAQAPPEAPPEFSVRRFNPGTVNPNFGKPGETYFLNRGYSAPTYTTQNPFAMQPSPVPVSGYQGYAAGGGIGSYAAGGKFLEGPGDGMSDDIKANIEGRQEARLADGEFVIPADVVADIGNGSSKAGSRQLYQMMDRVRQARHGTTKQPPAVNTHKLMPA